MGRRLATLALVLLAVAAAALLIVLISDGSVANPILLAVLTGAAVTGLGAWANERATARRHAALEEKRRGEMAARAKELETRATKSGEDAESLREQLEAQRESLTKERQLRLRTERARRAEREWARELREQVMTMYRRNGHSGDLRELVLEIAIQLSGAEKGVLLAQHDGDGDGKLDLVCHRGFERDPDASSLTQRFADRVIERDEIIRDDTPGDGEAPADDEISNILVPNGTPGYSIGEPYRKMGWNASDTRPLSFEDCRVPAENLVGGRGQGFKQFLQTLDGGRIGVAAMGLGLAQGAFDEALAYAKQRVAFGQPIASYQAIQTKLADLSTEIEAARLLTYKAALEKDAGRNFSLTAAQAKLKTGRLAVRASEEAVQIHGGYGYIEEYPVCRFYRDAKVLTIGEGTDEVQQMVIARALGC
jgi:hypothetical protein